MAGQLLSLNENSLLQTRMVEECDLMIEKFQKEKKRLANKNLYGSKSQKASSKKDIPVSEEEDEDNFDGNSTHGCIAENDENVLCADKNKAEEPYRKDDYGMSLSWMTLVNWLDKDAFFAKDLMRYSKI